MKKKKVTFMPCFTIYITALFNFLLSASMAFAEEFIPAFRHPEIAETEFQARSILFGVTPVASMLANRKIERPDLQSLLRAKTISAQIEWIDAQSSKTPKSSIAMDALIDLEDKADWNEDAQKIFLEFLVRKATLNRRQEDKVKGTADPLMYRIAQHLVGRTINTVDYPADQANLVLEAKALAQAFNANVYTFDDMPEDIFGVFVNGRWHPRSNGSFELYFPIEKNAEAVEPVKYRLTFISNLFLPKTIFMSAPQNFENLGHRQLWVQPTSPCSVDLSIYGSAPESLPIQPAIIGEKRCEALIGLTAAKSQYRSIKQIGGFGRGDIPLDPFRSAPPIARPSAIRPWVWVALGSVAAISILASARTKETQAQPNTHIGW